MNINPNVHQDLTPLTQVDLPAIPGDDAAWFEDHPRAYLRHRPPNCVELAVYRMTPDQTLLFSRSGTIIAVFGDPDAHGINEGHEMIHRLVAQVNQAMNGENPLSW